MIILILAATPGGISAETAVPAETYRAASRLVLESRYAEAENECDAYIKTHPEEPIGYLIKAAVVQYAGMDYEDSSREEEFYRLIDRAESLGKRKLDEDRSDLWARYSIASAQCFRGARSASRGSFVKGILKSRSGANGMAGIRRIEPLFYDAYLCDGSYRFWKSVATGSLRMLPFFRDEREKGIEDVRKAITLGTLTGPVAYVTLLEMLLEHDAGAAVELGEKLAREHPECRLFEWQLGEGCKKTGRFGRAVEVFTRLAAKYRSDPADDGSGQLRCWWKLAVLADSLGKREERRKYCEMILDLGRVESVAKRQARRIEGAKKFLTETDCEGQ